MNSYNKRSVTTDLSRFNLIEPLPRDRFTEADKWAILNVPATPSLAQRSAPEPPDPMRCPSSFDAVTPHSGRRAAAAGLARQNSLPNTGVAVSLVVFPFALMH